MGADADRPQSLRSFIAPNRGGSTNTASIARCARKPANGRGPSGRPSCATGDRLDNGARVSVSQKSFSISTCSGLRPGSGRPCGTGTSGIEILGDFPFMVTLDSADVWSRRKEFMLDASVGTPPDAFSETGQEWGLPPYNWERPARTTSSGSACARAGWPLYDGFRVDHLVGFYRTYVRPFDGRAPYFMPPDEHGADRARRAMMRIMIDSGADVSVEDLGTVPDFVRESIARLGLPGYKVLRWEPGDPALYPPRRWR